jgi:hypothetical protein
MVEDQNINNMVNALEKTDIIFTIKAILVSSVANMAKMRQSFDIKELQADGQLLVLLQ